MLPQELTSQINQALKSYSDKDWNYSRISLVTIVLRDANTPYVLWCELVSSPVDIKSAHEEVKWGERHSNELGILELVSLRLNKALLECSSDEYWQGERPIVRLVKKEALAEKGITEAFWYEVTEVAGEDFENR